MDTITQGYPDSTTLLQEVEYDSRRSNQQGRHEAEDSRLASFNKTLQVSQDESNDQEE